MMRPWEARTTPSAATLSPVGERERKRKREKREVSFFFLFFPLPSDLSTSTCSKKKEKKNSSFHTCDQPHDVPDHQLRVQHQHVHPAPQHLDHHHLLLRVELAELQVLLVVVPAGDERDDEHRHPDRDPFAPGGMLPLFRDGGAKHRGDQRCGHQQDQDGIFQGLEEQPQEGLGGDLLEPVFAVRGSAGFDGGCCRDGGRDEGRAGVRGGAEARGEAGGAAEGGEEVVVLVLLVFF